MFILLCSKPGPSFCDLIGKNCKFLPLLDPTFLPLSRQIIPNTNGKKALPNPVFVISLLQISFKGPINCLLWINRFFYTLPANLGQPNPEWFCFRRGNRLDKPQNLRVNWDTRIDWKLTKFFSLTLITNMIYDDDVMIVTPEEKAAGLQGKQRIQFKESLSFGFVYTFSR